MKSAQLKSTIADVTLCKDTKAGYGIQLQTVDQKKEGMLKSFWTHSIVAKP